MMRTKKYSLSKQYTIWKYGIVFGNSLESFDLLRREIDDEIFIGEIENMPEKVAETVAEIHPDFSEYYKAAMMPLYKTYNHKKGTESAWMAIESLKQGKDKEEDMPYVLIWKII